MRAIFALLVLIMLGTTVTAQSPRLTFDVNTTKDRVDVNPGDGVCADSQGKCSLRAAIMESNAQPAGGHAINLAAKTYKLTRSGSDETGGDLDIAQPLALHGSGIEQTVIDASALGTPDRVLDIAAGDDGDTTIGDLTITGGDASGSGGGILTTSSTNLVDVKIVGNQASDDGGGVACAECDTLNIYDSIVRSNSAGGDGGGLYAADVSLEAMDTMFSANAAALQGGGMFIDDSTAYLHLVTAHDNSAAHGGGGMVFDSNLTAWQTMWTHNTAADNAGGLGIIGAQYGLESSLFSGNRAGQVGGGLYIYLSFGSVEQASVIHNTAQHGGGLYVDDSGPAIRNITISGNTADAGGGVYFSHPEPEDYDTYFENVTITGNAIRTGDPLAAGGIDATNLGSGSVVLRNTIVSGNGSRQCLGALMSDDGNIFANTTDCAIATQSGDQTTVADPMLGPLTAEGWGGEIAVVHIPLPGSPALDSGANASCRDQDQRNVKRPATDENQCDVGAVEGPATSLLVNGSLEDGDSNGTPDGWTFKKASKDKLKCAKPDKQPAVVGDCAMKFKDKPGKLVQTVTLPAPADGTLIFGAYFDTGGEKMDGFARIKVKDAAGNTLAKDSLSTSSTGTYGFDSLSQWVGDVAGAASFKITLASKSASGKVWIDGIWVALVPPDARGRGAPLPPPPLPPGFRGVN